MTLKSDIESMFYQVKVPEEDADLLRFLWWPEGDLNSDVEEFRMKVHLFGATSSPSCASYALRKTAEDAKDIMNAEAVDTVLRHFYVDDCLKAVETSEQEVNLEDGYATDSYILLTSLENKKHCSLLIGKSRVTPLKYVTIPRLELTAAVLAVKMDRVLREELKISLPDSIFWTDSTTVLRYLSNESARFRTFVANRVFMIRDHSHPTQWRYVNSALNPADEGSRGVKVKKFMQNKD